MTEEVIFMRLTLKRILGVLFVLMLLPLAAVAGDSSENENENETENEAESQPVYVLDYFKGSTLDVSLYEGKALFLNFFTEWCPYCMEEMPDIKKIYDTYDPGSLEIILVHPWDGEDASNTASVVETYGLQGITTLEDEDLSLSNLVGIPGYPTSIVIDAQGYLSFAQASALDFDTFSQILDGMGIPKRDVAESPSVSTPVPSSSRNDAVSQATVQN